MKLLITGDLVVNRLYNASDMIDRSVKELFKQSDYNIVNLEAPITDSENAKIKTGPNLKANKSSTLNVLKTLRVNAVTLANNHVLDYGEKGLADTLQFCRENNITTIGAGMNIEEAAKTLYLNTEEGRVAIVNFAENEWSAATPDSAGFNPMDVIDNVYQIKKAKQEADYVLVIVHGGHEYYNFPSPRMQKQYRYYVEQGADIIIGHHSHCMNGYEKYKNASIYYSLGNFLFTKKSLYEDWYEGLVLGISIEHGKIKSSLHPVQQKKETFHLSLMKKVHKENIIQKIDTYNKVIVNQEELNIQWKSFIERRSSVYLNYWLPFSYIKNKYIRAVINKLTRILMNKFNIALFLNLLRCEAHRELSEEVLKKQIEK